MNIKLAEQLAARMAAKTGVDYEDLYSEALIAVWKAEGKYDGRGSPKGYTSQTISWRLIDYLRHRQGYSRRSKTVHTHVQLDDSLVAPPINNIDHLIWHLPYMHRKLLKLYYKDGYTMVEIANWLGITQQAVSEKIKKTLRYLKCEHKLCNIDYKSGRPELGTYKDVR